jgi:hypothetical protein
MLWTTTAARAPAVARRCARANRDRAGARTPTWPTPLRPAPGVIAAPSPNRWRPTKDRAAAVTAPGLTDQPSRHRPRPGRGPDTPGHPQSQPTFRPPQPVTTALTQAPVQISDSKRRADRTIGFRRLRKGGLSGSVPSVPHALARSCLLTGFDWRPLRASPGRPDQAPPMADTWALILGPKADAWRPAFRALQVSCARDIGASCATKARAGRSLDRRRDGGP